MKQLERKEMLKKIVVILVGENIKVPYKFENGKTRVYNATLTDLERIGRKILKKLLD